MNIKDAKEQIKRSITAYFTKDEHGRYVIPIQRQRPVFLMGPPGIGKTAIMEQIAAELGVGLISYSMTHHTRQSALGLPYITKIDYGGKEYSVSEYTMSEIIAAVYEMMKETGIKEGILFLDEINCVSETLAPVMLQFLQYKTFGRHRVPDGWIVVTAGNPPEYNNSVREFDIVTWDRLKYIAVEPDYESWKEYAYLSGVHPAILTYLDIKKQDFYRIESTVDGKSFVTARGWSDLSEMLHLYERHNLKVDITLTGQYLQNKSIAREFATYYDLFQKYRSDYQVDKILAGRAPADIKQRAKDAKFDERLSLLGLLLDAVTAQLKEVIWQEQTQTELMDALRIIRTVLIVPDTDPVAALEEQIQRLQRRVENGRASSSLSADSERALLNTIDILEEQRAGFAAAPPQDGKEAFNKLKALFDKDTKALKKQAGSAGKSLSNVFQFCEEVFGDNQMLLILETELTINGYSSRFITRYGCKEYFDHNKNLLFYERQREITQELESLEAL